MCQNVRDLCVLEGILAELDKEKVKKKKAGREWQRGRLTHRLPNIEFWSRGVLLLVEADCVINRPLKIISYNKSWIKSRNNL